MREAVPAAFSTMRFSQENLEFFLISLRDDGAASAAAIRHPNLEGRDKF